MNEAPLYRFQEARSARPAPPDRGTSLIRNRLPVRPYRRPRLCLGGRAGILVLVVDQDRVQHNLAHGGGSTIASAHNSFRSFVGDGGVAGIWAVSESTLDASQPCLRMCTKSPDTHVTHGGL